MLPIITGKELTWKMKVDTVANQAEPEEQI